MIANNVQFLLKDETGDKVGTVTIFKPKGIRGMYCVAQVAYNGGTANVKIFGRIDSTFAFKEIHAFTADDAVEIVLFPEMKAEITSYVSGTISLAVVGGL